MKEEQQEVVDSCYVQVVGWWSGSSKLAGPDQLGL